MLVANELRVKLKERRNRLFRTDQAIFDNEFRFFVEWLESMPYLRALVREIEKADVDAELWEKEKLGWSECAFPDTELKRAKVCLAICKKQNASQYAIDYCHSERMNDALRLFVERFVDPLVRYLEDRLEDGGSVLGILERYKRRTEWFHQKELFEMYNRETAHGEDVLDRNLREYLVDHGIDYPFSKPSSPSGEVDILAGLGSDNPLSLEVKVFGGPNKYGDAYVRKGFAQAVHYAKDYHVPAGYLVVFNLEEELLFFETEEAERWPPSVRVGDKTVFLIAIDINPKVPSASMDRKLRRRTIKATYLLDEKGN